MTSTANPAPATPSEASAPAASERPVAVEVRKLCKSYDDQQVLRDISLDIQPGEIFAVMGPSGAGKSVLFRHIIGLEKGDSGDVLIDGLDASDPATHRKISTGLVFQAGALFNSMSVYDNLALYPREHRLYDKATIDRKVRDALRALSLEHAAERMPAELSGGMKKRVAVARTLVMEPHLILYDEPTAELDPILAATISEIIATVRRETGRTSLVVTHDRDLALTIADRVAILMHGEILALGTPDDIRTCEDAEVQAFLHPKIDPDNPRFRQQTTDD